MVRVRSGRGLRVSTRAPSAQRPRRTRRPRFPTDGAAAEDRAGDRKVSHGDPPGPKLSGLPRCARTRHEYRDVVLENRNRIKFAPMSGDSTTVRV
jgi:hypothetical protein